MHFKEGLPRLLQYCKGGVGGVFPNITILHKGGGSLWTPNLYYVINGHPLSTIINNDYKHHHQQ